MADKDEKRVNPDPPKAPGTPEPPDLNRDPARFPHDRVRTDLTAAEEPPD